MFILQSKLEISAFQDYQIAIKEINKLKEKSYYLLKRHIGRQVANGRYLLK